MTKHITALNGTPISDKATVNLIAGTGVTLTVTEDADSVNVQIDNSATLSYATTSDIADVSSAESAGAATTVPRGDHVHAHEAAHLAHDTLWDTKGDIVVATAADTAAKLAVGTNDKALVADSAQSSGVKWNRWRAPRASAMPSGAIAETVPRGFGRVDQDAVFVVSGTVLAVALELFAGDTVTSISFHSGNTAGASMTHQYFGLHDSSRVRLAVSADDTSTAWAANTVKTLTMTTPYAVTTTGLYYVSFLVTHSAGAVPSLFYAGMLAKFGNLAPKLSGTADTGQTSIPSTLAAFTADSGTGIPYAYVS